MGTLFIVSTPIGNLDDITVRALKVLFAVDIIACEDTRRTGQLLSEIVKRYPSLILEPKKPKLIQYQEHTEMQRVPELLHRLEHDDSIALVSDAGTPVISDPGYMLVHEARKRNIPVVSVPGASALLAALTSSGMPAHSFQYLGYPPEKQTNRMRLFEKLRELNVIHESTFIFYVAPHKLQETLRDIQSVLPGAQIVLARELTKIHESVESMTIEQAVENQIDPKGEYVLLLRVDA